MEGSFTPLEEGSPLVEGSFTPFEEGSPLVEGVLPPSKKGPACAEGFPLPRGGDGQASVRDPCLGRRCRDLCGSFREVRRYLIKRRELEGSGQGPSRSCRIAAARRHAVMTKGILSEHISSYARFGAAHPVSPVQQRVEAARPGREAAALFHEAPARRRHPLARRHPKRHVAHRLTRIASRESQRRLPHPIAPGALRKLAGGARRRFPPIGAREVTFSPLSRVRAAPRGRQRPPKNPKPLNRHRTFARTTARMSWGFPPKPPVWGR